MSNQDISNLWWMSLIFAFSYNLFPGFGIFEESVWIMVIANGANVFLGCWGMYRLKRSVLFSEIKARQERRNGSRRSN
jgi:hypothetical protein